MGRAWIFAAGRLAILGAILGASGASGASLRPELKLEARYDDNVHATDHGTDDLVSVIAPGLRVFSSGPVIDWRLWARRSIVAYARESSVPTSTTDAVSFRAETRPKEATLLRLYSELRRSRDDSEPDDRSAFVPGKFRSGTGTAVLWLEHLEATARIAAWDYSRGDQSDATTKQLQGSLLPFRSRSHAWMLSYRGQELDVDGHRALTSHAALAGYRRRHSARLASRLEAGAVHVDHEDGTSPRYRGAWTAGLTLYGRESETPVVEARVEGDAATTVLVEARRRLRSGSATATWRRRLEAEGGYDPHPVLAQRIGLVLADTLGRGTVVSAEGSYAWTQTSHVPDAGTRTYRAGVFLSTPLQGWVTGRLGYDFLRQTDRDRPSPLHFRRSRILLSLTAQVG